MKKGVSILVCVQFIVSLFVAELAYPGMIMRGEVKNFEEAAPAAGFVWITAEERKGNADAVQIREIARKLKKDTLAAINVQNALLEARGVSANLEYEKSQENIAAKITQRNANVEKSNIIMDQQERKGIIDYRKNLREKELEKEYFLQEIEELKAVYGKTKKINAAEIREFEEYFIAYQNAAQAEIDKIKKNIESVAQEESAGIKHVIAKSVSVGKRTVAKVDELKQETDSYKRKQFALSSKIKKKSDALEQEYVAEVASMRSEAFSLEQQGNKEYETQKLIIGKNKEEYMADVKKSKIDVEVAKRVLQLDLYKMESDVNFFKKSKIIEINSLKVNFEDDFANRKEQVDLLKAEAYSVQMKAEAEEEYLQLRSKTESLRIKQEKDKDVISSVAKARKKKAEWVVAKDKYSSSTRKAIESNKKLKTGFGPFFKRASHRSDSDYGLAIFDVIDKGDVIFKGDSKVKSRKVYKLENVEVDIDPDAYANIKNDKVEAEVYRKYADKNLDKIKTDEIELKKLIDKKVKQLDAEIGYRLSEIETEKNSRTANIVLLAERAAQLEQSYNAEIEKMDIENEIKLKEVLIKKDELLGKAEEYETQLRMEVERLRSQAAMIENNVVLEFQSRSDAIHSLSVQGDSKALRLKAKAESLEIMKNATLDLKVSQLNTMQRVKVATEEMLMSEIDTKQKIFMAAENMLLAEIELNKGLLESDFVKVEAQIEKMKSDEKAVLEEQNKLALIQEKLYDNQIHRLIVQSEAERALSDANSIIEKAKTEALEKVNMSEVDYLDVKSDLKKKDVREQKRARVIEEQSRQARIKAEKRLNRNSLSTEAVKAAAEAQQQGYYTEEAYKEAIEELGKIKETIKVTRNFQEGKSSVITKDYAHVDKAKVTNIAFVSPIPNIGDVIKEK